MKKISISILIFILFIVTIIGPTLYQDSDKINEIILLGLDINKLYFGVGHIPSFIFIFGSLFLLFISKNRDENKVNKLQKNINMEFKQADELIGLEKYELGDLKILFDNKNKYLEKLKYIISIGSSEKEIEMMIDKYTLDIYIAYEKLKNDYDYISMVLPMLGMIGTIAGLLQMFGAPTDIGGEDDFAAKFAGLSVALATTLYASLLTVLVVKPFAREVDRLVIDTQKYEANILIKSKLFFHRLDSQVFLEYMQLSSEEENKDK